MNPSGSTHLRIVRLLEPSLCLACRFAAAATVEMSDEPSRRMLHCRRLDCDNWETQDAPAEPRAVQDDD